MDIKMGVMTAAMLGDNSLFFSGTIEAKPQHHVGLCLSLTDLRREVDVNTRNLMT